MTNQSVTKQNGGTIVKPGSTIPGLEGVEQDMLIIPRLKLVQKNSIEIDDDLAKAGEIVNSVTKDVVSKKEGGVTIIPIVNNRTRILFRPFDEGGGIWCQSFDGVNGEGDPGGKCASCPKNEWKIDEKTKKNKSPDCTELLNIFCIARGYDFPIPLTLSFGRTSMGAGRQLINFFWADANKAQKSPWNFAYDVESKQTENEYGKFYILSVKPGGMAEKEEIKKGETFYRLIQSTKVQIHEDEDEIRSEQERMNREDKEPDNSKLATGEEDVSDVFGD